MQQRSSVLAQMQVFKFYLNANARIQLLVKYQAMHQNLKSQKSMKTDVGFRVTQSINGIVAS